MIEAFGGSGVGEWPGVGVMLAEAAVLRKHQELFELHASDYLLLTRCQVCPTEFHIHVMIIAGDVMVQCGPEQAGGIFCAAL